MIIKYGKGVRRRPAARRTHRTVRVQIIIHVNRTKKLITSESCVLVIDGLLFCFGFCNSGCLSSHEKPEDSSQSQDVRSAGDQTTDAKNSPSSGGSIQGWWL